MAWHMTAAAIPGLLPECNGGPADTGGTQTCHAFYNTWVHWMLVGVSDTIFFFAAHILQAHAHARPLSPSSQQSSLLSLMLSPIWKSSENCPLRPGQWLGGENVWVIHKIWHNRQRQKFQSSLLYKFFIAFGKYRLNISIAILTSTCTWPWSIFRLRKIHLHFLFHANVSDEL